MKDKEKTLLRLSERLLKKARKRKVTLEFQSKYAILKSG